MEVGTTVADGATVSVGRIGGSVGCCVAGEHEIIKIASAIKDIEVFMSGFSLSAWAMVSSGVNNSRVFLGTGFHALRAVSRFSN